MDGYSPEENARLTEIEKSLLPFYGESFFYITTTRKRKEVDTPASRTVYGIRTNRSSPPIFKEEDAYHLSSGKYFEIAYDSDSWEMEIKNSHPKHPCSFYLQTVQILPEKNGLVLWNGNLPADFWLTQWLVSPKNIDSLTLWDKCLPLDTRVFLLGAIAKRFQKAAENQSKRIEIFFSQILPALEGVKEHLKRIKAEAEKA